MDIIAIIVQIKVAMFVIHKIWITNVFKCGKIRNINIMPVSQKLNVIKKMVTLISFVVDFKVTPVVLKMIWNVLFHLISHAWIGKQKIVAHQED